MVASNGPARAGVPAEVEGFSWAGFLWGPIWALGNGVWIGLFAFVPCLGVIMNFVLGVNGRRWAWERGRWEDVEHFNRVQRTWVVVWACVIGPIALMSLVLIPPIALYGVNKYVNNVKRDEARAALHAMAKGMIACAEQQHSVPDSSNWIPMDLSSIQGKKYLSKPSDWQSERAFECAGVSISTPQYFQYRWVQVDAQSGHFEAQADLDGNRLADNPMQIEVHCANGICGMSALAEGAQE